MTTYCETCSDFYQFCVITCVTVIVNVNIEVTIDYAHKNYQSIKCTDNL